MRAQRQAAPCRACPWRRDTEPGAFGIDAYERLEASCQTPDGFGPSLGDPLFACHKSARGAELVCAGWLAVAGARHPAARLAVATGELPPESLAPGEGWPDLFASFDEMVQTQAGPPGACRIPPPPPRD